jgi:hypothetical protein
MSVSPGGNGSAAGLQGPKDPPRRAQHPSERPAAAGVPRVSLRLRFHVCAQALASLPAAARYVLTLPELPVRKACHLTMHILHYWYSTSVDADWGRQQQPQPLCWHRRRYDSAGVCIDGTDKQLVISKATGKVDILAELANARVNDDVTCPGDEVLPCAA